MPIGPAAALALGSVGSAVVGGIGANKAAKASAGAARDATELQGTIYEETKDRFAPVYEGGMDAYAALLYEMGLGPRPTFGGTGGTGGQPYNIEEVPGQSGYSTTEPGYENIFKRVPGDPSFRVGDQNFGTRDEAQAWIDQQPQQSQGGMQYGGYETSPMAQYLLSKGTESIEGGASARGGLYSGATLEALENNRRNVITADTGDYYNRLFSVAGMGTNAAGNMGSAGQNYAANAGNAMMQAGNAQAQGYQNMAQSVQGGISDMAGIYGYFNNNPMANYATSLNQNYSYGPLGTPRSTMGGAPPMRPY